MQYCSYRCCVSRRSCRLQLQSNERPCAVTGSIRVVQEGSAALFRTTSMALESLGSMHCWNQQIKPRNGISNHTFPQSVHAWGCTPLAAVDSVHARTTFKLFIIAERLLHVWYSNTLHGKVSQYYELVAWPDPSSRRGAHCLQYKRSKRIGSGTVHSSHWYNDHRCHWWWV